jgi:hypothetical protein
MSKVLTMNGVNGNKLQTCPMGLHKIQNIHNGKVPSGTVKAGGQDKKAPGTYIKWDAPGVETIQPDEKEKIQEVSDQFNRFQMMNFNEHMHCLRGTHLKTQGVRILRVNLLALAHRKTVRNGQVHRPRQPPRVSRPRHVQEARLLRCNHALLLPHTQDRTRQRPSTSRHRYEDLRHRGREDLGRRQEDPGLDVQQLPCPRAAGPPDHVRHRGFARAQLGQPSKVCGGAE